MGLPAHNAATAPAASPARAADAKPAFIRSPFRRSEAAGAGLAIALFLAALAVRSAAGIAAGTYPFLTFFPAVVLTAFLAGTRPAALCTIISTAAAWYYFIPPLGSFGLDARSAPALLLFLAVCATIVYVLDALGRTARQLEAEQAVSLRLIEEQRIMFAELQHRVANNLTFLSSLLLLQKRQIVADPTLAPQLIDDAVRRLQIMGRLHRRLHEPGALSQPLPEYLKELCGELLEATGARNIVCLVDADDVRLDLTKLTAMSLLLTELMTNSVKHAFAGREGGTISVSLHSLPDGSVALDVGDDGPGLPDGYAAAESPGLGLKIIKGLAAQLGAELSLPRPGGASTRVVFAP